MPRQEPAHPRRRQRPGQPRRPALELASDDRNAEEQAGRERQEDQHAHAQARRHRSGPRTRRWASRRSRAAAPRWFPGTRPAAGRRRCRAAVRTVATMNSDDEPAEREELEAAQPEGEPRPGQAHAARSTGDDAGRGVRAAARWPSTTSSSVAGRPPAPSPRTRLSRSPAGPGKTPTTVPAIGRRRPARPTLLDHGMLGDRAGDRQVEQRPTRRRARAAGRRPARCR